jgi:hypothetical protein
VNIKVKVPAGASGFIAIQHLGANMETRKSGFFFCHVSDSVEAEGKREGKRSRLWDIIKKPTVASTGFLFLNGTSSAAPKEGKRSDD